MITQKPNRKVRTRKVLASKGLVAAGLLFALFFLAYLDFVTSRFIQLSLFYALISGFAGWTWGRRAVVFVVCLSTVFSFATDRFSDPSVPLAYDIANHGFRALLWSILGIALVSLRKRMNLLDDAYDLIRTDLEAGRKVQSAFLSRALPEDPRLELGVEFRTARELGGDYFDIRLVDEKLQVVVADVSGKGASAALVTALFGGIFSELSRRYNDPAKVLRILDKEISSSLPEGMFITAFFLVLDVDTGEVRYASAGHDPQFWIKRDAVQELNPTGLPVGLLEGFELDVKSFHLEPGDSVMLFTDGVTNVKTSDQARMGEEPLLEFIKTVDVSDARALSQSVFRFVDGQGQLDDDAVVLVLRLVPGQ